MYIIWTILAIVGYFFVGGIVGALMDDEGIFPIALFLWPIFLTCLIPVGIVKLCIYLVKMCIQFRRVN